MNNPQAPEDRLELTSGQKSQAEFQRLCEQVREQQEVVNALGSKFLKLITGKRWKTALTAKEICIAKLECAEASAEHMEEEEFLEALRNALKINFKLNANANLTGLRSSLQ